MSNQGGQRLITTIGTGGISIFINPGAGDPGSSTHGNPEAPDLGSGKQSTPVSDQKPIISAAKSATDQPSDGDNSTEDEGDEGNSTGDSDSGFQSRGSTGAYYAWRR